jgi:hypothetical protein
MTRHHRRGARSYDKPADATALSVKDGNENGRRHLGKSIDLGAISEWHRYTGRNQLPFPIPSFRRIRFDDLYEPVSPLSPPRELTR